MLIFAIRNERLLEKLRRRNFLGKFFTLRVEELDTACDRGLVDHLYKSFYVDNDVSKETSAGRFADIDTRTISLLKRDSENLIHDVGVSSGITSLDLYDRLEREGYRFKLYISDKFARFHCTGHAIRRIYDSDNVLTRAYVFSLLVDGKLHPKYFVSKYAYKLIKLIPFKGNASGEIVLYDQRLRSLLEQGLVSETDYDVFRGGPPEMQFDFVRCMNLLNRSYFSDAEISRAIDNLKASLKESGVLLIGRTNAEGKNNASFFRRNQDCLNWIEDFNEGSEIKELTSPRA